MKWITTFCLLLLYYSSFGQKSNVSADSLIIGTWRGTSVCQVKDSPCHDEISVCHISKTNEPGRYRFVMNKMVNGVEEDMGVSIYQYDPVTRTLINRDEERNATGTFILKDKTMEGELVFKNVLYRVIKLKKD